MSFTHLPTHKDGLGAGGGPEVGAKGGRGGRSTSEGPRTGVEDPCPTQGLEFTEFH